MQNQLALLCASRQIMQNQLALLCASRQIMQNQLALLCAKYAPKIDKLCSIRTVDSNYSSTQNNGI